MLVCTMLQETGCYVGKKRIVWVKVNPDYEILFRLMDGLRPDTERRYWIREPVKDGNICDIGEDMGQIATEIKIAFPMSHDTLISVDEYIQVGLITTIDSAILAYVDQQTIKY